MNDARAFAVMRATQLLGEPYIWGGDDHDEGGFDCSGLVHEIFSHVGQHWSELRFPRMAARDIYKHFSNKGCTDVYDPGKLRPGMLTFFCFPRGRIFHVKLHVSSGPFGRLAIDAGGAGSNATGLAAALRVAAGVRMSSSIHHNGAHWVAIDPFELIGEGGDLDPVGAAI